MKCQNCGYESKNLEYCPVCGEKIESSETSEVKEEDKEEKIDEKVEAKTTNNNVGTQYKVFAIIGYVLGIVSLALVWVPFMFFDAIPGMVFSKIGDKPTDKQAFAKKGYTFSLIGLIINVVWTILFYVIIVICAIEIGGIYFD